MMPCFCLTCNSRGHDLHFVRRTPSRTQTVPTHGMLLGSSTRQRTHAHAVLLPALHKSDFQDTSSWRVSSSSTVFLSIRRTPRQTKRLCKCTQRELRYIYIRRTPSTTQRLCKNNENTRLFVRVLPALGVRQYIRRTPSQTQRLCKCTEGFYRYKYGKYILFFFVNKQTCIHFDLFRFVHCGDSSQCPVVDLLNCL